MKLHDHPNHFCEMGVGGEGGHSQDSATNPCASFPAAGIGPSLRDFSELGTVILLIPFPLHTPLLPLWRKNKGK